MAKPTSARKSKTAPTPTPQPKPAGELSGELRQLASIREGFPAISHDVAADLLALHDDDACRERGASTKAADVFRGAMAWARTFGAHKGEAGVSSLRVRWFLDCLTVLGTLLTGRAAAANPADESAYDDAAKKADRLLTRVSRRAHDAVGTRAAWRTALDAALTPVDDVRDARVVKLTQLADLMHRWLHAKPSPALAVYDITAATVTALREAAAALEDAIAARPPPGQVDRDSPAINAAEGRLLLAMRPLWDDLAEAREDGLTSLQLTVSPAILRGLDVRARKSKTRTG